MASIREMVIRNKPVKRLSPIAGGTSLLILEATHAALELVGILASLYLRCLPIAEATVAFVVANRFL